MHENITPARVPKKRLKLPGINQLRSSKLLRKLLICPKGLLAFTACLSIADAASVTFSYTGGLQHYTTSQAGQYQVVVIGGSGGLGWDNFASPGGQGTEIITNLQLSQNELLTILVGRAGGEAQSGGGGGGGASYVTGPNNVPLVIAAGGGGGGGNYQESAPGRNGYGLAKSAGGNGGPGGGDVGGGGGGGFSGNGSDGTGDLHGSGGFSYLNGGGRGGWGA